MSQITNLRGERTTRGGRTCAQPRCETAEISRESLIWLWYLNYGHFYTLLVWHVPRLIAVGFGIGDTDTWRRRSFTPPRNLHLRAEWVARDRRPSFVGLNSRYPFKERRSMADATTRHAGLITLGKNEEGVKKWRLIVPHRLFENSHHLVDLYI